MQTVDQLKDLCLKAINNAITNKAFSFELDSDFNPGLERPKDDSHGDFACTVAMRLSKQLKMAPRDIAQIIVENFPDNSLVNKIEIAGPGFINFYLSDTSITSIVNTIRSQKFDFGKNCAKGIAKDIDKNVNLEYISANPTGPMHVGHGR